MGNSWSTRHDYYVHQFDNPRVQQCSKTMIVNVKNSIDQNIFQSLISADATSQQIVLISLSVASIQNEYAQDVVLFFNHLFPHQPAPIRLLCPAHYSDVLDVTQRILYQNTVKTDKILLYSGLNNTILSETNTDASPNSDSECFPDDHPIVEFIVSHGSLIKDMLGDGDVQKKVGKSKPFYIIKKDALRKIRAFFETKVYNEIHYTRFEDSKLSGDIPPPDDKCALSIILNIEYAIVNPGNGTLFRTMQKLN
jgi:hypothetical protein